MLAEPTIQWDLPLTAQVGPTWWSNITCSMGYSDQSTEGVLIELQRDNLTVAFCKLFSEEQAQGNEFVVQRVPSGCTFSGAEARGRYRCILSVLNHGNDYLTLYTDTLEMSNLSSANTVTITVSVVFAVVAVVALVIAVAVCTRRWQKGRSVSYRFRESDSNGNQEKRMEAFNEIICE